ncbi:MAG TPA: sigma-70 family RNA polymerase sigma factor [Rudaea sp.]
MTGLKAASEWFGEAYDKLLSIARRELRRMQMSTLDTTALVHEVYLKLCVRPDLRFSDIGKFLSYVVTAMRHVLINRTSHQFCVKAGFGITHVDLSESDALLPSLDPAMALQLDAGLDALQIDNERAAKVVELHYFAGLSLEQIAFLLGVARRTVDRDWKYAKNFLLSYVS